MDKKDENSIKLMGVSLPREFLENILSSFIEVLPPEQKEKFGDGRLEKIVSLVIELINRRTSLTKENKKLADELLMIGERDLKYSKIAFEEKDYDKSTRDMTTAIDSMVLAFGVSFLGLTEKEAKEINHHSTRAFTNVFYEKPFSDITNLITDMYKNEIKLPERTEVNKSIDSLWNSKEAQMLDENQLDVLLNITEKFRTVIRTELNKKEDNSLEDLMDLIDLGGILKLFEPIFPLLDLYVISFVAYPHYLASQFPTNPMLKPEDYTLNLGIVKVLPKILDKLSEIDKELIVIVRGL